MHSIIIAILIALTVAQDRVPSGGANCTKASDCGKNGGLCEDQTEGGNVTIKRCICFDAYGDADCSYKRYSKAVTAGLQIGLSFISIDGVGWLVMGERQRGLAQLLMGLAVWISTPLFCVALCVGMIKKGENGIPKAGGFAACLKCVVLMVMISAWAWSIADGAQMINDPNFVDPNGFTLA